MRPELILRGISLNATSVLCPVIIFLLAVLSSRLRTPNSSLADSNKALSVVIPAHNRRDLLVRWAEEALRSTRSAQRLVVAVHPETLAELGGALDQLLSQSDLPEQTHIEPDESVDRNDVVVRQLGGEINAGLTAQLRRLEEMLA